MSAIDVYNVFEVDAVKPWQVLSHYFPDKVGGRPAWLSLKPLPSSQDLACGICKQPCVFLLQKYAPTASLHRTIFLFVCRNPDCCRPNANGNFVVLRSQLSFVNDFYPKEPPNEEYCDMSKDYPSADKYSSLCVVCGCAGLKKCGRCHQINYCTKEHQRAHWSLGHKSECTVDCGELKILSSANGVLFPEFILDIPDDDSSSINSDSAKEVSKVGNFEESQETTKFSVDELEEMAAESEKHEDDLFDEFKNAMKSNPFQVLRYHQGGFPLWVTDKNVPQSEDNIPNCGKCGAKRQFEFQVMPQLLNHLGVDNVGNSIDWATLVVYTCSADCDVGGQYGREFVWKQDY